MPGGALVLHEGKEALGHQEAPAARGAGAGAGQRHHEVRRGRRQAQHQRGAAAVGQRHVETLLGPGRQELTPRQRPQLEALVLEDGEHLTKAPNEASRRGAGSSVANGTAGAPSSKPPEATTCSSSSSHSAAQGGCGPRAVQRISASGLLGSNLGASRTVKWQLVIPKV